MIKVLYISSADPTKGPGAISMNHYNALREAGFKVDFLTLSKVPSQSEIKYIYEQAPSKFHNFKYKVFKKFFSYDKSEDHNFFFLKDTDPPVPISKILRKIDNDYNVIIIYFWQQLLSYKTILEIYKYCINPPKVIFICADYSPMTGGCHFIGDCRNYQTGCGKCPMIYSKDPNDFTAQNVRYRKEVISQIKPYVRVGSYMSNFFKKSSVMKNDAEIITTKSVINHDLFKPLGVEESRKKYDIPSDYKFIILFGCQNLNDTRKGMSNLVDSLNIFYSTLTKEERKQILLVSIGKDSEELDSKLKFKRQHLGYVDVSELPQIYSLANIFVSPSINDAGPTMVNQSIACGTPVVAYEIGSALDVVKDQGTGFTVPILDTKAFAKSINDIYRMSSDTYKELRNRCREISLKLQSKSTLVDFIQDIVK